MLYDPKWHKEPWRQTLLNAAGVLRERGLAKFTQEDKEGRVCLHGAISIAAYGKPCRHGEIECKASEAVVSLLRSRGVTYVDSGAAAWNNKPERTIDEVIEVLESAAAFNLVTA